MSEEYKIKIENYEKYWQKGGTYVLPIEVFNDLFYDIEQLQQENNSLLELCMFALIRDTKIYNHELDNVNKRKFINAIKDNINDDTYTLRKKLIDIWRCKDE